MVKIKLEKTFNVIELMQYVWDNNILDTTYDSYNENGEWLGSMEFDECGNLLYLITEDDVSDKELSFTLEIEEDIKEDTVVHKLVEVYDDFDDGNYQAYQMNNASIADKWDSHSRSFYTVNSEGELVLLWSKNRGMQ